MTNIITLPGRWKDCPAFWHNFFNAECLEVYSRSHSIIDKHVNEKLKPWRGKYHCRHGIIEFESEAAKAFWLLRWA